MAKTDPGISDATNERLAKIDQRDPNWLAAAKMLANDERAKKLTEEQRALRQIELYGELSVNTRTAGIDYTLAVVTDSNWFNISTMREAGNLFYSIWGPIVSFLTSNAKIGDQFSIEVREDQMYRPRSGEKAYASRLPYPDLETPGYGKKLDDASNGFTRAWNVSTKLPAPADNKPEQNFTPPTQRV